MGRKSDIGDSMDWPEENEYQFMQLLCARVRKDPNNTPSFKISDWEEMDKELYGVVGVRYGADRLKGKYQRFRIKFRHFLQLLDTDGVTWNEGTNTIQASDRTWQALIKQSKDFRAFRKRGCKHFNILRQIFPKLTAGHQFTLQNAMNYNEDHASLGDFLNRDFHADDSTASGGSSTGNSSKGGSYGNKSHHVDVPCDTSGEHRQRKRSRMEKIRLEKSDEAMHVWVTAVNARSIDFKATAGKDEGQMNETSTVSALYTMEKVMDILEGMVDVPSAAYMKAVEKLTNPDWRMIFGKMSCSRRREWLKTLE